MAGAPSNRRSIRTLIPENEKGRYYAQFNIDGLMRGDYKSRMEGYAIARQNGWMSANRHPRAGEPQSHLRGRGWERVSGQRQPDSHQPCGAGRAAGAGGAERGRASGGRISGGNNFQRRKKVKKTAKPLTLGSLFDGIGGFPLGGEVCGHTPLCGRRRSSRSRYG